MNIENLYKGRAIINGSFDRVEIIIPTKKNWFIIIFLGAWLGGWVMGETFALTSVTGIIDGIEPARFFIFFWLIGWTVGGFFAFRTFLWNFAGKEVLIFENNLLKVDKRNAIFFKAKIYDLNEARGFRVQEDIGNYAFWGTRRNDIWNLNSGGTIRFDYGLQTIKIAGGIDEAEAKYILSQLSSMRLLTDKNFESGKGKR